MGWLLKHRERDNRWRIWTTISDGWITGWLTENEAKEFLASEYHQDYKLKVIEAYWSFPHGWSDKDTHKRLDNRPALLAYQEWHMRALKGDDYYGEIDRKFKELTEPLN